MSAKRNLHKKVVTAEVRPQKVADDLAARVSAARSQEIGPTVAMIIDAVADMLARGGHQDAVDSLILAAMRHRRRTTFDGLSERDPEQMDEMVKQFVREDFGAWRTDLAIAWRKNKRPEAPAYEAKTITEMIRFNTRARLEGAFESFLSYATPEEQSLMLEVLVTYQSSSVPAECKSDEIVLGNAFEDALGRGGNTYVKIPSRLLNRTQKYLDALRAIDDKAAA